MNFNFLSRVWTEFAPGLGNHLWQSTIFAAVVAGLALALRGNQARTRYWLWLAASLKFLFPFSLLVSVGSYLAIPHAKIAPSSAYYSAFEQFGQPFAVEGASASLAHSVPMAAAAHRLLSDRKLAAVLTSSALAIVRDRHSPLSRMRSLMDLYRSLHAQARNGTSLPVPDRLPGS